MLEVKIKRLAEKVAAMMRAQRKLCAEENGNYDPIELSIKRSDLKTQLGKDLNGTRLRDVWIEELGDRLEKDGFSVKYYVSKVREDIALIVILPPEPEHKTKFKSLKSLFALYPELSVQRRLA